MAATSDLEKQAKDAFVEEHFELAADLLTQGININPNSADLYADRAQAYIKLNFSTEAIADSSRAIELDPSMSKAYLRKGLACMKLEEYVTAKAALEAGAKLAPENSRFTALIKECEERIAEETGQLAKPVTEASPSAVSAEEVKPVSEVPSSAVSAEQVNPVSEVPSSAVPEQPAVSLAKPKYRHEFYQKPEEVIVTIFAKGVPVDSVSIEFGEQILSVSINVPGEDAYHFQPRLFGKIIPEKCKFAVLSTKVEIRMAKAEQIHWTSLEYSKEATVVQRAIVPTVAQRPAYPSSKPGRVDWDKLEAQVKKEEKEEKLDGDAALNKFFRDIYQDADEDTRRAMRKSFVESNGTVLSTNWKEVGSKKVEGSPPDGMELKKWEY